MIFQHIPGFVTRAGNSAAAQPKWLITSRLVARGGGSRGLGRPRGRKGGGGGRGNIAGASTVRFGKNKFSSFEKNLGKLSRLKKCHLGFYVIKSATWDSPSPASGRASMSLVRLLDV